MYCVRTVTCAVGLSIRLRIGAAVGSVEVAICHEQACCLRGMFVHAEVLGLGFVLWALAGSWPDPRELVTRPVFGRWQFCWSWPLAGFGGVQSKEERSAPAVRVDLSCRIVRGLGSE